MNAIECGKLRDLAQAQEIKPYILDQIVKNLAITTSLLGAIDAQRRFLITQHLTRRECPFCDRGVSYYEAVEDDDYRVGNIVKAFQCPHCANALVHILPMISTHGWHWAKKHKAVKA